MAAAALSPQKSTSPASSGNSNEFQDREVPFEMAQATVKVRVHSDHVSPVSYFSTQLRETRPKVSFSRVKKFYPCLKIGLSKPYCKDFLLVLLVKKRCNSTFQSKFSVRKIASLIL